VRTTLVAAAVLVAASSVGAVARGQALVDPMRPPVHAAAGEAGASSGPVLQQVYVSRSRRYAVIDGTRVSPGDRYGNARVMRISEAGVALQGDRGTTVLTMHPDVLRRARPVDKASRRMGKGEERK